MSTDARTWPRVAIGFDNDPDLLVILLALHQRKETARGLELVRVHDLIDRVTDARTRLGRKLRHQITKGA